MAAGVQRWVRPQAGMEEAKSFLDAEIANVSTLDSWLPRKAENAVVHRAAATVCWHGDQGRIRTLTTQ